MVAYLSLAAPQATGRAWHNAAPRQPSRPAAQRAARWCCEDVASRQHVRPALSPAPPPPQVYSGTVRKGDNLVNVTNGKRVRVPRLVRVHSDELEDIASAVRWPGLVARLASWPGGLLGQLT